MGLIGASGVDIPLRIPPIRRAHFRKRIGTVVFWKMAHWLLEITGSHQTVRIAGNRPIEDVAVYGRKQSGNAVSGKRHELDTSQKMQFNGDQAENPYILSGPSSRNYRHLPLS